MDQSLSEKKFCIQTFVMNIFTLATAYVMLETFKLIINAPVNMLVSKL